MFCLTVARRYKLDPFKQQIWFVKRWDKNANNGKGGTGSFVWTPQVGINGLLFAAGRDHKAEFGSVGLPGCCGPMVQVNPKLKAPEWAKVQVWKKGSEHPTEAQAYWDEYAPAELEKAPFWRKMPRRMLGKCATALAIRQAYPDLGGLYIPEECDRIAEEFTPSGRQIVQSVPTGGSKEAAAAVLAKKLAEHASKPKEAEIVSPVQPESKPTPSQERSEEYKGIIELDWVEETSPKVYGDLGDLLDILKKHCTVTVKNDYYHVLPKDVETIRQLCEQAHYRLVEHMPPVPPSSAMRRRGSPRPRKEGWSAQKFYPSRRGRADSHGGRSRQSRTR